MGTLSTPFYVNILYLWLLAGALLSFKSAPKVPQGCPNLGDGVFEYIRQVLSLKDTQTSLVCLYSR